MDTDQEILASRDMLGSTFDDAKPIFAMHTEGDSMVFAGIPEHSIIIVNQAEERCIPERLPLCVSGIRSW